MIVQCSEITDSRMPEANYVLYYHCRWQYGTMRSAICLEDSKLAGSKDAESRELQNLEIRGPCAVASKRSKDATKGPRVSVESSSPRPARLMFYTAASERV